MNRLIALLFAAAAAFLAGCETVPISGRSQLILIDDKEVSALAAGESRCDLVPESIRDRPCQSVNLPPASFTTVSTAAASHGFISGSTITSARPVATRR